MTTITNTFEWLRNSVFTVHLAAVPFLRVVACPWFIRHQSRHPPQSTPYLNTRARASAVPVDSNKGKNSGKNTVDAASVIRYYCYCCALKPEEEWPPSRHWCTHETSRRRSCATQPTAASLYCCKYLGNNVTNRWGQKTEGNWSEKD